MKDILGTEIHEGDYIAYAVRSGNSGALCIGRVKKTEPSLMRMTIRGVNMGWDGTQAPKLNTRDGNLYYGNRVAVLLPGQLPATVQNLLS